MTAEAMVAVADSQNEPKEHMLVPEHVRKEASKRVLYEKRPVKDAAGKPVAGLFNAWITLDNPTQFNSYTTDMVKAVILAFREASAARDVVAVVLRDLVTRRSAPAATPGNMPSTTPAIRRNIAVTCGCSTTWCRRFSPAINR